MIQLNKKDNSNKKITKKKNTSLLVQTETLYQINPTTSLLLDIFPRDSTAAFFLKSNGVTTRITGALPFDEIKNENLINGILLKLKNEYNVSLKKKKSEVMAEIAATIEINSTIHAKENNKEKDIITKNHKTEKNNTFRIIRAKEDNSTIRAKEGVNSTVRAIEINSTIRAKEPKKTNKVIDVAKSIDTIVVKENDENKEIDNSTIRAKEKDNSTIHSHNTTTTTLKDFTIVHSILFTKEKPNTLIRLLMRTIHTIESEEILEAIDKFEYFTESMIIVESNIKQRTVNKYLRKWVDIGLLKRKQDPIKYKIHNKARPFSIYFWNDLPEPFPEIESQIIHIHQTLRLNWWKKATPSEKLLKWVNQSYSMLSSTRLRDTGRIIPKTPAEQRQLLTKKAERYGLRLNDKVYQLLDYKTFTDFKEFRKQLINLVTGRGVSIDTDKDQGISPIKREKKKRTKFICEECNRSTYKDKKPEICPYENCEGVNIVEGE